MEQVPDMAVEIRDGTAIHEAHVLDRTERTATVGNRGLDETIDRSTRGFRQGHGQAPGQLILSGMRPDPKIVAVG
mgnify:CR=1 FL=1